MPIPKPRAKEKRSEYVSRFMSSKVMQREFPKRDQRLAVAYRTWRRKK